MNALRHADLAVSDLLDILPDAVIMVDETSRIAYVNPAVRTVLGYEPEDILDQPLSMLIPEALRERHELQVATFRRDGAPTLMGARPVLHAVHRSGRLVAVSISLCNLALRGDTRVSVAVIHDVSVLHTNLDRATAQAETDALTGIGNRLRLSRRMQALLVNGSPFGILSLDLERFKLLNDRHGHAAGDEALRIVGRRLQALVRQGDLVARLGGDEFVLLLDGVVDDDRLHERARAVAASLLRPMHIGTLPSARLGVNIGGASCPRHGRSTEELLVAADRAMYDAKQGGEAYRVARAR